MRDPPPPPPGAEEEEEEEEFLRLLDFHHPSYLPSFLFFPLAVSILLAILDLKRGLFK